ncbi:MAG TPA: histidine--tRNA ligase [Phycisphaerae bacterium]|nr:histidine--tRNA ligase [Phycisphaerae bacterium]
MSIQCPPGMRDFYPEDMRVQNWLFDQWRRVSRAFGFSEYEGPIFEFLELYELKSGAGIVSELFSFTDRGERHFAIRPEMTPTLARMVAARANALPRPIKWFSIPRMCRAEKPQRGRLREFFQWNVDTLGSEDPLADAEVVAVAVEFLRRVGLSEQDVAVRLNHRGLMKHMLEALGVPAGQQGRAFELIDRSDKIGDDAFRQQWRQHFPDSDVERVIDVLRRASLDECLRLAGEGGDDLAQPTRQFREMWERLRSFACEAYCVFDPRIVRGLAYYTGAVFEVHARRVQLRALLGGGRYDDLTGLLDGPRVPGVGFGMGDAPMLEALRELGKLPQFGEGIDAFVIDAEAERFDDVLGLVTRLRREGLVVDYSYKRQPIGKQLKQASARAARYAVIVGQEWPQGEQVALKDMSTGEQRVAAAAELATCMRR